MEWYEGPVWTVGDPDSRDFYYFDNEEAARWFQMRRGIWPMNMGSKAIDGKNFFMTLEEKDDVIKKEPKLEKFIRQVMGSDEFINGIKRYCFWLVDATPSDIKKSSILYERVKKVKEFRLASSRTATQKTADKPALFAEIRQPDTEYLLIPRVSSENRKYIPMGYVSPDVIVTDAAFALPHATLYHLGILQSQIHMAWMRVVCGRLRTDYRYSSTIVYNNFVWPKPNPEQVMKVERTGRAILEARAKHPESSFADLYDEVSMPPDLRRAHQDNDAAVMEVYGFPKGLDEMGIVTRMMELYHKTLEEIEGRNAGR